MNLFAPRPGPVKLARVLMQILSAQIDDPREFADALAEDRFVHLDMRPSKGRDDRDAENWRDRDAANAHAGDFLIKVRALEKKLRVIPSNAEGATSDQKDAHWLALMVEVWRLAIGVYWASGNVRAAARDLADKAGESAYFERMIEPLFRHRVALPSR
ncbi:MAG TPA: hypothetical protein VFE63_10025 [Roseiarcus sp.]|jgi:hypothetical protein|nr:hypothetical protein [Roseiarcus sp.]